MSAGKIIHITAYAAGRHDVYTCIIAPNISISLTLLPLKIVLISLGNVIFIMCLPLEKVPLPFSVGKTAVLLVFTINVVSGVQMILNDQKIRFVKTAIVRMEVPDQWTQNGRVTKHLLFRHTYIPLFSRQTFRIVVHV